PAVLAGPDLQLGARGRQGTADLPVRPEPYRAGVGARLHLGHRAPWPRRHRFRASGWRTMRRLAQTGAEAPQAPSRTPQRFAMRRPGAGDLPPAPPASMPLARPGALLACAPSARRPAREAR